MREYSIATAATTFECKRCAKCCSLDVMLSDIELEKLGKSADRKWRTTKKVSRCGKQVCELLDGCTCGIYACRPKLCRIYPFMAARASEFTELGMHIDESASRCIGSDSAEYVVLYDDTCPGISHDGAGIPVRVSDIVELTIAHLLEFRD